MASVAAAPLNSVGVLGAYPQASLYAWDASPSGAGITAGDVIQGLDAAMRLGAGVVNLSLGSQIRNPLLDSDDRPRSGAGVLVVAAAGNSRQRGQPARVSGEPSACRHRRRDRLRQPADLLLRAARPTSTSRRPARSSTSLSRRRSTRRPTTTSSTGRASPRRSSRPPPTGSGRCARTWTGRRSPRCCARRAQDIYTPGLRLAHRLRPPEHPRRADRRAGPARPAGAERGRHVREADAASSTDRPGR